MRAHVVANTVLIAVFVAVVVVVVVSTSHGSDGHAEGLHVFSLKFKHVFTLFKMVNVNHRA